MFNKIQNSQIESNYLKRVQKNSLLFKINKLIKKYKTQAKNTNNQVQKIRKKILSIVRPKAMK